MGIHTRIPTPRLVASGGPVSRALLVMQDADPDLARIRQLRRSIAARIEADLAWLDALSGDPDFEEDHDFEDGHDAEASTDDNGIADDDGMAEQFAFSRHFGGVVA